VDAVRRGLSRRGAANAAGISYPVLKKWITRGRAGEFAENGVSYGDFVAQLEGAEAVAEQEMVDCLFLAAKEGKHDAAKFWLSSRRAADYASKVTADVEQEADEEQAADDLEVTRSVLAALESRKVG
jgi:hypothetical protein